MNSQLLDLAKKIPFGLLLGLYLAYLGWDYYSFMTGTDSPLADRRTQQQSVKQENDRLATKLKQAQEFYKTLDAKRAEIRGLAEQLDGFKATLSDRIDVPAFLNLLSVEAAKTGVKVLSVKPLKVETSEYYQEQPFELHFRGVYPQVLAFLEKLSDVERVTRVDEIEMKSVGTPTERFTRLEGTMVVKTYRYKGSKADEVADQSKQGNKAPGPRSDTKGGK